MVNYWADKYIDKLKDGQKHFNMDGSMRQVKPAQVETFTGINGNVDVMCPFCLWQGKLSRFLVSTKNGVSQGTAKCPECNNGMRMKSLWADMNATQYADWVYGYSRSGFWKKCPFDTWRKRLVAIGWAIEFWARYKELKGSDDTQSIFSDAEKMARDYGIDINQR